MWKGFFGFLIFVFAFVACFFGFAMIIAGFAMFAEKNFAGPLITITGMIVMYLAGITCRTLAQRWRRILEEDAKNPPPARYIPGKHRCDPRD